MRERSAAARCADRLLTDWAIVAGEGDGEVAGEFDREADGVGDGEGVAASVAKLVATIRPKGMMNLLMPWPKFRTDY